MKIVLSLAVFCLLLNLSFAKKKQAESCPGCPEEASANDEKIREVAEFAVGELGYTLTEILEAKTQVVQGTNYILTLKVKDEVKVILASASNETNTDNYGYLKIEIHIKLLNDKPHRCEVEVYERLPGDAPPNLELTGSSCENIQRQRVAYFFSSF